MDSDPNCQMVACFLSKSIIHHSRSVIATSATTRRISHVSSCHVLRWIITCVLYEWLLPDARVRWCSGRILWSWRLQHWLRRIRSRRIFFRWHVRSRNTCNRICRTNDRRICPLLSSDGRRSAAGSIADALMPADIPVGQTSLSARHPCRL